MLVRAMLAGLSLVPSLVVSLVVSLDTRADVEPEYRSLLDEGMALLEEGDSAKAAQLLELASIGLLENPPLLAKGLAHLALAQSDLDRHDALVDTGKRLLEAEIGYAAYTRTDLEPEVRDRLEPLLAENMPLDMLIRIDTFAPAARDKLEERLGAMSPSVRRAALPKWIELDPEAVRWRVMLAETGLEIPSDPAAKKTADAAPGVSAADVLAEVEPILDDDPGNPWALCVRGRALSRLGRCDDAAMNDLARCRAPERRPAMAEDILRCALATRRADEARTLLDALPEAVRREKTFRRMARDLRHLPPPGGTE